MRQGKKNMRQKRLNSSAVLRNERSSKIHTAVRQAHAGEKAQDYCEIVASLIDSGLPARVTTVATELGVTHVTAIRVFKRLARQGLVSLRPYKAIELTPAGLSLAKSAAKRHLIVYKFLRSIGISHLSALHDAEGIEHHVSAETLKVFEKFVLKGKNKTV